jgi:hypothetical protein
MQDLSKRKGKNIAQKILKESMNMASAKNPGDDLSFVMIFLITSEKDTRSCCYKYSDIGMLSYKIGLPMQKQKIRK